MRAALPAPAAARAAPALAALAAAAAAAGLAACSPSVGGSCSLTDPCGDGVCNLSGPGEPECVDADGDLDGDGLPNRLDFCNQIAGGEHDEDGDGLGDLCDPCPIAPPPAMPDRDTDGVDSPCDPDPATDGDRITVFEGFNGPLPSTWRKEGAWEAVGGAAVYTGTDPAAAAVLLAPLPQFSRYVAMIGAYRIDRVATGATQSFAGISAVDRRPAGTTTVSCGGQRTGATDTLVLTTDTGTATMPLANLFDPAALYQLAQRIENASGGCALSAGSQRGQVQQGTGGEAPTEAGFAARGVDAKFPYLLVMQRPN